MCRHTGAHEIGLTFFLQPDYCFLDGIYVMRFWSFGPNHRVELWLVRFRTFTLLNTAMFLYIYCTYQQTNNNIDIQKLSAISIIYIYIYIYTHIHEFMCFVCHKSRLTRGGKFQWCIWHVIGGDDQVNTKAAITFDWT